MALLIIPVIILTVIVMVVIGTIRSMDNTPEVLRKNLPRDVFLYVFGVIALATVCVNFGALLFQFVNYFVPDIAQESYYSADYYKSGVRTAVSFLVFVFPVFLWLWRFISRDVAKNPEKREFRIRRWLLYLTLFVAGSIMIGDMVALLNTYLQGELSARFGLKVLTILFIAASVFFYFRNELRSEPRDLKYVVWGVIGIVAVAIVGGFIVAGSPQSQRMVRLDEQRVGHLSRTQSEIISFWQYKERLPQTLGELRNDISGYIPDVDPETKQPYEYTVTGTLSFRLCALFKTDSGTVQRSNMPVEYGSENVWTHSTGRVCFDRTIDPQLYPPIKNNGAQAPMPKLQYPKVPDTVVP